jgi:hypothetical protein
VPARLDSGRYRGHSGKHILVASLSQADPKQSSSPFREHNDEIAVATQMGFLERKFWSEATLPKFHSTDVAT